MKFPVTIKTKQLQLGDTVKQWDTNSEGEFPADVFKTCVVRQITDGQATLFRPYVHMGDFKWTGGVLCYLGTEEWKVSIEHDSTVWLLLERRELR